MNKLIYHLIMIALFFSGGFIVLLGYWYVYPYEPLEIKEDMKILNEGKSVSKDEMIIIEVDFKKNTKITPLIDRKIVDGVIYSLDTTVSVINETGEGQNIIGIEVPHSIPDGKYYLKFNACYQMNPIRIVCVDYKSEEFEIIK